MKMKNAAQASAKRVSTQQKKMMSMMNEAAKYEKGSKFLQEKIDRLGMGSSNATNRYNRVLDLCKKEAEKLHVDVRHASASRTKVLEKQVHFLETTMDNLRRYNSALDLAAREMKQEIDELRLQSGRMDSIFDIVKAEIQDAEKATSSFYDSANIVQTERSKILRQIQRVMREDQRLRIDHAKSIKACDAIVEEERKNAAEAQRQTHLAILAERQAHRRGHHNSGLDRKLQRKATLGRLSDEEEEKMRERMNKLEHDMRTLREGGNRSDNSAGGLANRPAGEIQKFHERITKLHLLAKIRKEHPGLEHKQQLNTLKRCYFEDIEPESLDIETIIMAWKKSEKECFELVKNVQELNADIRESEAETKLIKARIRTMENALSSSSQNRAMEKTRSKRVELDGFKQKQLAAKDAAIKLKDEISHICKAVDNALSSTSTRGGDIDVDVVRPFNLLKYMGVLEARAIDIIGAYMIFKSMCEDTEFQSKIQKQVMQGSPVVPLLKHRKYRLPTGPRVPGRRHNGLISEDAPMSALLRSSPLKKYNGDLAAGITKAVANVHVIQDRPLTISETRGLFRTPSQRNILGKGEVGIM